MNATLIADSGSTKTTWSLLNGQSIVTQGLNPHITSPEAFLSTLQEVKRWASPNRIFFYGAGCGSSESKNHVTSYLSSVFPTAEIHVFDDMLGACRALCANQSGLVGILGTGSNACYYNGTEISHRIPAPGYLLADEGSGNHIGKTLLKSYIRSTMPSDLSIMFHDTYNASKEDIVPQLYQHPYPNRFLASFVPFAIQNQRHPFINQLLVECFNSYFHEQIIPLQQSAQCNAEINLIGSVAALLSAPLAQAANLNQIKIGKILADPMPGLIEYHSNLIKSS